MKRSLCAVVILLLMTSLAWGQSAPILPWRANAHTGDIMKVPIVIASNNTQANGGKTQRIMLTTNNDTSVTYTLPPFREAWIFTKVRPPSAHDSVDIVIFVQGNNTNDLLIGRSDTSVASTYWQTYDSTYVTIGDTLQGDSKKLAIPPGINTIRFVFDGITKNDKVEGVLTKSWLYLTKP